MGVSPMLIVQVASAGSDLDVSQDYYRTSVVPFGIFALRRFDTAG
jgi:hypothetical protein